MRKSICLLAVIGLAALPGCAHQETRPVEITGTVTGFQFNAPDFLKLTAHDLSGMREALLG